MDTEYTKQFGGVELVDAIPILLRHEHALQRLRRHLGPSLASEVDRVLVEGLLAGSLGDEIHDFFADEILNESTEVWYGETFNPEDETNPDEIFPVGINEYCGVFYVWALEFDEVGYFLQQADAENYVHWCWENVRKSSRTLGQEPS